MTTSYKINDNLYLVSQTVSGNKPMATTRPAVNHIAVIDVSYSMQPDLPKIADQLKKKLPKLLNAQDTISIIWFSGRSQFGTLLEAEPVATLTDLQSVNAAIDRWIRPVGATGFTEPLEEASRLIERVSRKNPGAFNLLFMSDGCDNQGSRQGILNAASSLSKKVSSATFVEYGYYADRALLTSMAEQCGGNLIFAEDFDKYAPSFENALNKEISGAKKIKLELESIPVGRVAFSIGKDSICSFYFDDEHSVEVSEDESKIYYLTTCSPVTPIDFYNSSSGTLMPADCFRGPALAAIALYAQRMNSDVVLSILKVLGDVRFIRQYSACYGKQKYSEFVDEATKAVFDEKLREVEGYDPNLIPPDDAFTILDLLTVLSEDEDNRVLLDSSDFSYSKIGRGRLDSNTVLTADEQIEVDALNAEMSETKDLSKIKELSAKVAAIVNKPEALKFVPDKQKDGYPISSLIYAEERPNVSFKVRKEGRVDISKRAKGVAGLEKLTADFETYIWRNYAVIKDGLVNIDKLPVRMTAGTIKALKAKGMPIEAVCGFEGEADEKARAKVTKSGKDRFVNVTINLKALPIVNRKMVNEVSANELFTLEYMLTLGRAAQKVFNHYKKELFPKKSENFEAVYGATAAEWLKEQGITDYNGFNPKGVVAPATDFYVGKELNVSLKGYSTLPKVEDVKVKLAAKAKLTPTAALMSPYVQAIESILALAKGKEDGMKTVEQKLNEVTKAEVASTRALIMKKAQIVFSVIVAQTWFPEFSSLEDNTLKLKVAGEDIQGSVTQKEIQVAL